MSFFLTLFLLIYGGMHLYVFVKARSALAFSLAHAIPLAVFMLLMTFCPVIVRLLEKAHHESAARMVAYAGYTWMGLIFIFISISLVADIYRIAIHSAALLTGKDLAVLMPARGLTFHIALILSIFICVYAFFEANNIGTETITIKTKKIPKEVGRIKIVQISDVHIGLIVRERRVEKIMAVVKSEKPDVFVSTGDLVDGMMAEVNGLSSLVADIDAPYGKYAIAGNHEFYAGLNHALDFTRKAGFVLLRGAGATISGLFNVAGVDDSAGIPMGGAIIVDEGELLATLPRDKFTLLLKHRPDIDAKALGLFDLQLSGHTHKGQIFPFALIVRFFYPKISGLYPLGNGSALYTNRGTGTWGPPLRFLSPPEVTIINVVYDETA